MHGRDIQLLILCLLVTLALSRNVRDVYELDVPPSEGGCEERDVPKISRLDHEACRGVKKARLAIEKLRAPEPDPIEEPLLYRDYSIAANAFNRTFAVASNLHATDYTVFLMTAKSKLIVGMAGPGGC